MIESSVQNITKIESWILAARPKTLPAAFVPVIIGSSIAVLDNSFKPAAAFVSLICALLIQMGTNFVNDLYDYFAGSDKVDRVGPTRVITSGLITVTEMKIGIFITFTAAFILGLYLVYVGGWIILLIGVLSIAAGIAYTAGPLPLAYNGLGDIFVFIFFGFVGTVGTYYIQANHLSTLAFWGSVPVGALITNILVVNNYRDIHEDRSNGKKTLAVKFGKRFARFQYLTFMVVSYAILFIVYYTYKQNLIIFLPLLSLPIAIRLIKMIFTLEGKELNKTLALTAKLSLIYGLLFAIGILI